jgi:uncharacterized membrane protein
LIDEQRTAEPQHHATKRDGRSILPSVLLGIGLGGFLDGIVLHQLFQWHSMASAVVPPTSMGAMRQNMMWDGFFHLFTWAIVTAGIYALLRDARLGRMLPSAKAFTGLLLVGWGTFNLLEGLIDHHLLGIHHVRDLPAHVPIYDWAFLLIGGVALVLVGRALAHHAA